MFTQKPPYPKQGKELGWFTPVNRILDATACRYALGFEIRPAAWILSVLPRLAKLQRITMYSFLPSRPTKRTALGVEYRKTILQKKSLTAFGYQGFSQLELYPDNIDRQINIIKLPLDVVIILYF
jgi:hypothetical protein